MNIKSVSIKGFSSLCGLLLLAFVSAAAAQDECDAACKAQDPLADVRAIMTDNTIAFGTSDDQTSYNFQVQPVYSIPTDMGFNFIARAIVPIMGARAGADLPNWVPIRSAGRGSRGA